MRRIKPEYDFDLWLPKLAPPETLLKTYIINEKIAWKEFKKRFLNVLKRKKKYLKLIASLAEKENVTLLCWEKSANRCHRKLLAKECKKINQKLKVKTS